MSQDAREVVLLPNGARIAFDPMPHLRTASVGVWLGAGARHEAEDRNGLAHFLEHMAFKGAAGLGAREIAEVVEARGAVMNAATDYERTSYFVRCLHADAPHMLDIALSLVFAPDHPKGEIAREKGVVLQEIGEAADQPDDLVMELAQTINFPDHPLGRPVLGTEATLKRVTRDDLFGFAASNYAPARTVVSVAGAFDRAAVEAIARKWLEPRTAIAPPIHIPVTPQFGAWTAANQPRAASAVRDLEQCHLVLSRPAPSALAEKRHAARLFAEIFGGGMASRLFQEVREEKGLAYTIDASCDMYSDAGHISVYAGCAAEDAVEVAKITSGIWSDLAANGVTASELDRAKAIMKTQIAMGAEAPAARAGSAAYELLFFDRLVPLEETLASLDAVTLAEVQAVAATSLSGPATAAAVGSKSGIEGAQSFVTT